MNKLNYQSLKLIRTNYLLINSIIAEALNQVNYSSLYIKIIKLTN